MLCFICAAFSRNEISLILLLCELNRCMYIKYSISSTNTTHLYVMVFYNNIISPVNCVFDPVRVFYVGGRDSRIKVGYVTDVLFVVYVIPIEGCDSIAKVS